MLRAKTIELTDKTGRVRMRITAGDSEGDSRPQLMMLDPGGRTSVLLSVSEEGQGTLYFSSPEKEGKVALGYVWGSDSLAPDAAIDPLAFWGMRVLGQNVKQLNIGIGTSGKSVQLDRRAH